ncbi:MAG: hypothetical protein SGJ02_12210 [bacterium]|nr:hypothetical protein [bacterium]
MSNASMVLGILECKSGEVKIVSSDTLTLFCCVTEESFLESVDKKGGEEIG